MSAADVAALEFVTWWYTEDRPWGEKIWPIPATSAVVACHMVEKESPMEASGPTPAVACLISTPR